MDHERFLESSSSASVNILPNIITYLRAVKYLNIKLRLEFEYQTELKVSVRKIEHQMLYHGCKDSRLLCWKLKILW